MCLHQNGLTQMALWAVWVAGPQTNSQTSNAAGVSTWCLVLPSTTQYLYLVSRTIPIVGLHAAHFRRCTWYQDSQCPNGLSQIRLWLGSWHPGISGSMISESRGWWISWLNNPVHGFKNWLLWIRVPVAQTQFSRQPYGWCLFPVHCTHCLYSVPCAQCQYPVQWLAGPISRQGVAHFGGWPLCRNDDCQISHHCPYLTRAPFCLRKKWVWLQANISQTGLLSKSESLFIEFWSENFPANIWLEHQTQLWPNNMMVLENNRICWADSWIYSLCKSWWLLWWWWWRWRLWWW